MTTIEASFRGTQGDFTLDAAFSVPAEGVTALFGPSGCGKTTVLRCIAGLTVMADGRLTVNGRVWQDGGKALAPHKRPIGYVFQDANLFPHLSVRDNLTYGRRRSASKTAPAFDDIAELLGLGPLLDRSPARLSGGEKQRAAIGRALLTGPDVLLMDEPLAALDRASKNDIIPYLETLHRTLSIPVIYVSHDIAEVERLADRMVLMDAGRVRAVGPLAGLLADPALPFARTPDAASVIDAMVVRYDSRYGLTTVAAKGAEIIVPGEVGPVGAIRRLRVLASDVALCRGPAPHGTSILNALEARIVTTEPGERQIIVFLGLGADGGGARLMARITRKSWDILGLKEGEAVTALVKGVALAEIV